MSPTIRDRILAAIVSVAPDIDPAAVLPEVTLREQFDFDSMDTLHLAVALKREFGIDVPDADLRELATLQRCTAYVEAKQKNA
jgi:acyl carrier protein